MIEKINLKIFNSTFVFVFSLSIGVAFEKCFLIVSFISLLYLYFLINKKFKINKENYL